MDIERKDAMRAFLFEYAAMRPAREPRVRRESVSAVWYGAQMRVPAFAAIVLFLFTGGTAYAAQGALPGDPLYGFKVNVNETLQGALALSPSAKADWAVERASRRLEEASTLAATGKLTPSTALEVQHNIDTQVPAAAEKTKQLEEHAAGTAAVAASAKLAATLSAHADILAALSEDIPDPATRDQLHAIVATVETEQREANAQDGASLAIASEPAAATATAHATLMMAPATAGTMHASVMATVTASATAASSSAASTTAARAQQEQIAADPAAVLAAKAAATAAIATVTRHLAGVSTTTDGYAKAQLRLAAAQDAYAAGESSLAASSTARALDEFDRALANAVAAQAYFSATEHFLRISTMLDGAHGIPSQPSQDRSSTDASASSTPSRASTTDASESESIDQPAGTSTSASASTTVSDPVSGITHDLEGIASSTRSGVIRLHL